MERPWWGESSWRGWKGGALLGAPACDGNPWNLLLLLQVTATLETIWRKVSPALLLLLLLKGEMETVTMDNSKKFWTVKCQWLLLQNLQSTANQLMVFSKYCNVGRGGSDNWPIRAFFLTASQWLLQKLLGNCWSWWWFHLCCSSASNHTQTFSRLFHHLSVGIATRPS